MSIEALVRRHLPGWPQGSPGELHLAASCWLAVAEQLRALTDSTQGKVRGTAGSWRGAGRTAFDAEWTGLADAIRHASTQLDDLAKKLNNAADQLANAQHRYEVATGAAALTFTLGAAATLLTFGASDVAAADAAAAEITAAVAEAEAASSVIAVVLEVATEVAVEVATRFAVFAGIDLAAQTAIAAVVFPGSNPFSHLDLRSTISVATALASPELAGRGLATRVTVGGLTGVGLSAVSQEVGTGKFSPLQAIGDGIVSGAGAGFAGRAEVPPTDPAPPASG